MTSTTIPGLRDLFVFVGLKQLDVAQQLGIDSSVVSLWVVGRRGVSYRHLAPLAAILGLTVEDLTASAPQAPEPIAFDPITYRGPRCSECDVPMRRAKTRTRCQSCLIRGLWRAGKMARVSSERWDRWTHEEDDRIRTMAGKSYAHVIAENITQEFHTVRTAAAVQSRAIRLGVYLQLDVWSQDTVCRLFGSRPAAVRRHWLDTGLLKATRCRYGRWTISDTDLEAFIRSYPWAYAASRMQPSSHPLARLARDLHRRDPWFETPEAATYLEITKGAFRRWCARGVIPYQHRSTGVQGGGGTGCFVVRVADLPEARRAIQERRSTANRRGLLTMQAAKRDRRAVAA